MKIGVLVGACLIPLFIVPVNGASQEVIDQVMSDYALKADAYSNFGNQYMAFLNFDKANDGQKDTAYNNWQLYKNKFEAYERQLEKSDFSFNPYQEIINLSWENKDLQTTIKYSNELEKNMEIWVAYQNKMRAELLLGKYDDALNTFEKLAAADHFEYGSPAYVRHKLTVLYASGNYDEALKEWEKFRDDGLVEYLEKSGLGVGHIAFIVAMIYEKQGDSPHSANFWYNQIPGIDFFGVDCGKATSLFWMGLYDDVIQLMESNNNLENCPKTLLYPYVISKDIQIGNYHPPIEHVVQDTGGNNDILCGAGTELINGQCLPIQQSSPTNQGGGCLIATAAYGSEMASQVQMLREIRDNSLLQTQSGQFFMQDFNEFYYSFSPVIADYERENPVFKEAVKITITPLITSLSILNHVEIDSEADVLGYGISLILLNVGMYIVAPAIVIFKIRKKSRS